MEATYFISAIVSLTGFIASLLLHIKSLNKERVKEHKETRDMLLESNNQVTRELGRNSTVIENNNRLFEKILAK